MDAESPGDDHAESPDEPLRLEFTNNELAAAMSTEMEDCVLESLKKLRDGEDRNEISSLIGHVESLRSIRRKASNRCFLNAAAVNATSVQIKSDALAMLRNYQREFAADKICGACDRELPNYSFSGEQWGRRQSIRRCKECAAAGKQLVLMTKGRERSEDDDCPICNLPLSVDVKQTVFQVCCMKKICTGCLLAVRKHDMWDCPFCRTPLPNDDSQILAMVQKRVDAGDPVAIWFLGSKHHFGQHGLEKDAAMAVELYERATELGVKDAHFSLGRMYAGGIDVEKDTAKAIRQYEAAAVCGHVSGRFKLGCEEYNAGNNDLALQHFLIAAKMGHENSLTNVKNWFMQGLATKADYAEALRGYQSAAEEMKSPDRDEALAVGLDNILQWQW